MKVLGIVCSPRVHSNSEILMRQALKSAADAGAETEMFAVAGKKHMLPCSECRKCAKPEESGLCVLKDDLTPLFDKILEADGIIFSTPIFFWSVSAQAKMVIDRTYGLNRKKKLRNKVGAALVVATRIGHTGGLIVFSNYFNLQRMVYAGSATGFAGEKGAVLQDERAMAEAKAVGRVVVRYMKRAALISMDDELERPLVLAPRKVPLSKE